MADLTTRIKVQLDTQGAEGSIKSLKKEIAALTKEIELAEVGSDKYNAAAKRLAEANGQLQDHRNKIKGVQESLNGWQASLKGIGALAVATFTVDAIVGYGKELFNTATKMEALEKKAQIVFADTLPQVTAAAKENAAAMGLTNSEYVAAAANIQDLLVPMGFQRQEAANISTAMVDLSGALSEWTGGQKSATEVAEILNAAVLGEREGLKQLGIAISEEDVKARLAQKGLSGLTGEMLQQAKAAATLELITEKSADAQAAFAEGAGSLARQQAEMGARFRQVTETLSTALIPVFSRLLEVALPIVETVADIVTQFTNTDDAAKATSPTIQLLIDIFGNFWEKLKALGGIMFQVAKFIINNFTPVFYGIAGTVILVQNAIAAVINTLADFTGSEFKVKPIDIDLAVKSIDELKNKINSVDQSELFGGNQKAKPTTGGSGGAAVPTKPKPTATAPAASAAAPKPDAKADREAKELEEKLAKERAIQDAARALRAEFLSEDLEDIERGFLETSALEAELLAQDLEAQAETDLVAEQAKAEEKLVIEAATQSDYEKERLALQAHYEDLLQIAELYGIDTTELRAKYAEQVSNIDKKEADKRVAERTKELEATAALFGSLGDLATSFAEISGAAGEEAANTKKVLTLAQLAFDTAAAISGLTASSNQNAANGITGGLAGIAQYAAGIIRIFANINQARKIINGAPKVKQKALGGWSDVTGEDDQRQYRAKYIGRPGTGMLNYSHPVLLANERGREYYVDAETLRNPYALRLVQSIENIKHNRGSVMQRAEGGYNQADANGFQPVAPSPAMSQDLAKNNQLMAQLITILSSGRVYATITDSHLREIFERNDKINAASGT